MFFKLADKGCYVMLSNSGQNKVIKLYKDYKQGYKIAKLDAIRWLGANGNRFKVKEIIVTNYNPLEVN